jgi:membrane associated rhomboid family serine protease
LAISVAKSRSDPTGLLFLSSVSCGGYEVSEQTVSVPAVISWAAGTVGSGVAVGAIDAAVVVAALAAVVGAAVGVALGAVVAALLEHALATRAAIAKTLAMRIRE